MSKKEHSRISRKPHKHQNVGILRQDTVMIDANPEGLEAILGAILIQINSKSPRIIAYGNKSLTRRNIARQKRKP